MSGQNKKRSVQLLIGPAGSGKTHACLEEIRTELKERPQGSPLLLLAPKQATFQMEHALLQDPDLHGYTRLQILSFDRLAEFILSECQTSIKSILSEEGRVMVIRSLLNQIKERLRIFHASTKLPGLAQELSRVIREFQQSRVSPQKILDLSSSDKLPARARHKLHDIGILFQEYQSWIQLKKLHDPDHLLDLAADALRSSRELNTNIPVFQLGGLWMDGFASLTPQELNLLTLLAPLSNKTVLAFCADSFPEDKKEIFSIWLPVHQTIRQCTHAFSSLDSIKLDRTVIKRSSKHGRFQQNHMLKWLESKWTRPMAMDATPFDEGSLNPTSQMELSLSEAPDGNHTTAIEIAACQSPEAESIYVARAILRQIREEGMRFNQTAVLVRSLPAYQEIIRHTFDRYGIPCFIDHRESVAHHPLVELTRCVLRLPAFGWTHDDWFTYLKTGLTDLIDAEIDDLENAAIERGWRGLRWWNPLEGPEDLVKRFEPIRRKLLKPIKNFIGKSDHDSGAKMPQPWNGIQLAAAFRKLWKTLNIEYRLETWDESAFSSPKSNIQDGFHIRVLEVLEAWLLNFELAFAETPLPIREWIPIVDAGLNNLTVGVIPPAIDQVLVGAIDRSRNPDLKSTYLMGLNESVFPAKPTAPMVFDELERLQLENAGVHIGSRYRTQLATERFLGYIGCTRATEHLTLSYALNTSEGKAQAASVFIQHVKRIFPQLKIHSFNERIDLSTALHARELLISPEFWRWKKGQSEAVLSQILPNMDSRITLSSISQHTGKPTNQPLNGVIARHLYSEPKTSPTLYTSVSRIEAFAECPFRFFVQSGLKTEERMAFELDARRLGSFQHAALEAFHMALEDEGLRWHDLTPSQARELMKQITSQTMKDFHEGLMEDKPVNRVTASALSQALGTFVAVIVEWMSHYSFEPIGVEVAFGGKEPQIPAWEIQLSDDTKMVFNGIIDRVDLCAREGQSSWAIVIDYKSGKKKPDEILSWNGVQLQLPVYLNVLRQPGVGVSMEAEHIQPAGAFFTTLRAKHEGKSSRKEALNPDTSIDSMRKAYQHVGCFDVSALDAMDQREGATKGEQFQYQLNKNGAPRKTNWHVMSPAKFDHFLHRTRDLLKEFGQRIFEGDLSITPYQQSQQTPCQKCDYTSVCRIDPWTQQWRQLEPACYGESNDGKEA